MNEPVSKTMEVQARTRDGRWAAIPDRDDSAADISARVEGSRLAMEPDGYQRYWASVYPGASIPPFKGR